MNESPAPEPGEPNLAPNTGWVGGRAGCMAAFLFAFPTCSVALIATSLGDCGGDPSCAEHRNIYFAEAVAIVLALAALFGVAVRLLVRWRRLRGTAAAPRGWAAALAAPVALVLGLLAIWCELAILGFI